MLSNTLPRLLALGLLVGAIGCPGADDDDDATADDDDDSAVGDDDDDDDDDSAVGDDDDDDDSAVGDDDDDDDDDSAVGDDDDDSAVGDDDDDSAAGDDDDSAVPCTRSVVTVQGMNFASLCADTFEMGCTAGQIACGTNESPARQVTLTHDFLIGEVEVAQGRWTAFMATQPFTHSTCGGACPAEQVSFHEMLLFANAISAAEGLPDCYTLTGCTGDVSVDYACTGFTVNSTSGDVYGCAGYRLPTEAEWEYAARGGQDLWFSGSSVENDVAWWNQNSGAVPHFVGSKQANAFGVYDMSGNVWEFVQDAYAANYYSTGPSSDPPGPATGDRVARGGSFGSTTSELRTSKRLPVAGPDARHIDLGFRLARTAN